MLMHLGVVRHWIPLRGLPLPFVSLGGVELCLMLASLGVVLNMARLERDRDEQSG
jgi:cell division protein FtsW (lipid II flippase)